MHPARHYTCAHCGGPGFQPPRMYGYPAKYCSVRCYQRAWSNPERKAEKWRANVAAGLCGCGCGRTPGYRSCDSCRDKNAANQRKRRNRLRACHRCPTCGGERFGTFAKCWPCWWSERRRRGQERHRAGTGRMRECERCAGCGRAVFVGEACCVTKAA